MGNRPGIKATIAMNASTLVAMVRDDKLSGVPGRCMAGSHTATGARDSSAADTQWREMAQWQETWRLKFKRQLCFYFDTPSLVRHQNNLRKVVQARIGQLERKVRKHGGVVLPVLHGAQDPESLIVVSNLGHVQGHVQGQTRTWDLDKLTRFFQNYERDIPALSESGTTRATNTDVYPMDATTPHIYLYDMGQRYRPLITRSWDVALLNHARKARLPYPVLQRDAAYGRSPFARTARSNDTTLQKRYTRDCANERYALRLRRLYARTARPAAATAAASPMQWLELQPERAARLYAHFRTNAKGAQNSRTAYVAQQRLALHRAGTIADVAFESFREGNHQMSLGDMSLGDMSGAPFAEPRSNDSLSSNDTVATLTLSELEDTHEPRTSLRDMSLRASLFSSQQDSTAVNEGVLPLHAETRTQLGAGNGDEHGHRQHNYCENCHAYYTGTLVQHAASGAHLETARALDFAAVDSLIAVAVAQLG